MARDLAGNPPGELDDERAQWSFGRLLTWHLVRGTRAGGDIHLAGRKWTAKAFADATGLTDRTVRYWLKNEHLPPETETIERVLFGDSDCYADWRIELRYAHSKRTTTERGDAWSERPAVGGRPAIGVGLSPPSTISNIPQGLVPRHFMGREDALATVGAALQRYKGPTAIVAALHGLRGIGKTVLAAAYAEFHRDDYRVTWWLRAQAASSITTDLLALGERLVWIGADESAEAALVTVIERLRRSGDDILLIYDNAIDAVGVKPYLPNGGAAHVLITSNAPAWRGVAEPVAIQLWPRSVGADYLITRTGRSEDRSAAEKLSEILGGLPLAHEQAGAYCESVGIPLAEYVGRFAAAPARMMDTERYAPAEYHDRLTVTKTFALAIEAAAKLHPAAEPLIVHAALLPPEPIPLFLFYEAREKIDHPFASMLVGDGLDDAIAVLRAFGLVDRELVVDERDPAASTDMLRLHRLVREIAADRCQRDAQATVRGTLIEFVAAVYPQDNFQSPKSRAQVRYLDSLALALVGGDVELPVGAEGPASHLLDRLASYRQSGFGARAQTRAQTLFERALVIRERALGPDHLDTAISLINLAALLRTRGDLDSARPLYERALAIKEKALGPDHLDTTALLDDVAELLVAQGDLISARPLYERAVASREKVAGPEHLDTAKSLTNLAHLVRAQGDLARAQLLYQRALAINEKQLGPDQHDTMTTISNLARARWFQVLGLDLLTTTSLTNLAKLLHARGGPDSARPLYERALAISERVRGPDHLDTATCLSNLARSRWDLGDLTGARQLYEQALAIRERLLGLKIRDTAKNLNILIALVQTQGDFMGARRLYRRTLTTDPDRHALDHLNGADSPSYFAGPIEMHSDLGEARPPYERALAISEKMRRPEGPDSASSAVARPFMTGPAPLDTAHALSKLVGLLRAQSDAPAARRLYEHAVAIVEEALGPDDLNMLEPLSVLAWMLRAHGNYAGARLLYQRAVALSEAQLGPNHLGTAVSLNNLAGVLQVQGDFPGARPLYRRALSITANLLGANHPDAVMVRISLGALS